MPRKSPTVQENGKVGNDDNLLWPSHHLVQLIPPFKIKRHQMGHHHYIFIPLEIARKINAMKNTKLGTLFNYFILIFFRETRSSIINLFLKRLNFQGRGRIEDSGMAILFAVTT